MSIDDKEYNDFIASRAAVLGMSFSEFDEAVKKAVAYKSLEDNKDEWWSMLPHIRSLNMRIIERIKKVFWLLWQSS